MPAAGSTGPSTRTIVRVFLTVVLVAAVLYFLYLIRSVVGEVAIAVFLSVALGPAVDFFVRHRVPRIMAILLTYLCMAGAIVGVGLLVVPPVVNQVNSLADKLPTYIDDIRNNETLRKYDQRYHITKKLEDQASQLPSKLGDAAGALQSVTVGVFSALVKLITVLTMTFFLLLDGGRLFRWLVGTLRPEREERIRRVAFDVYDAVSGYVAGNLMISLLAGLVTYFTLLILGVPFAVPLAILMAFLDLIPLVGATIGALAIGIVTLFNDFPTSTIVWAIVSVVYQQIENNVVQPVVYRKTVDVHPLLVIVAILIGASLVGVLGALVAIPVAAAVQIVVRDAWRQREPGSLLEAVAPNGVDGAPPAEGGAPPTPPP
jgi:predicted PurR-regulated permease PerM